MRILITGGKSALAFRLRRQYQQEEILMADYGEMPQFGSAEYQFMSLGPKNADTTAHTLLTFCLDNAVEAILPVNDFEIEAVSKSRILFEEFNIHVLTTAE